MMKIKLLNIGFGLDYKKNYSGPLYISYNEQFVSDFVVTSLFFNSFQIVFEFKMSHFQAFYEAIFKNYIFLE